MDDSVKWLFTIASKNDIPNHVIYDYIKEKYEKTSVRALTPKEMQDTLAYVSDSRMVKNEKQIVRIIAIAKGIPLERESLDRMCSRFGGRRLEDLEEEGLRGMMKIVTSMAEKGKHNDHSDIEHE